MLVYTLNWGGNYTGSISRIIRDIEDSLKQDDVTFVHYYESGEPGKDNYFRLSGWLMSHLYYYWAHFTGNRYGTGTIPAKKFINAVKQGRPDVVHIHCPNGFSINIYMVLDYLKKNRIPTVVTNHAEFFYTGNCAYAIDCTQFIHGCQKCPDHRGQGKSLLFDRSRYTWKRMKKAFEGFEKIAMVGVSPWSVSRIGMSDITSGLSTILVENGVDCSVFRRIEEPGEFAVEDDRILILQVTSSFTLDEDDLKGGRFFWRLASKFADDNRFLFIVAGEYRLGDADIPKNMKFLGVVGKEDLARLYSACDLTVTTGKRETFGMTCAESLCCGTPVAGFINGGSESISIARYAEFVEYGDTDALKEIIYKTKKKDAELSFEIEKEASKKYAIKNMSDRYMEIYKEISGVL